MPHNRPLPPLSPPLYGVFLSLVSALTTLLLALAFTFHIAGESLNENWQERLTQKALIALPPLEDSTKREAQNTHQDPRLLALNKRLSPLPQIHNLHILRPEDIQTLLSTWSAPWPAPLPLAMSFSYEGDNQALENFIHKIAQDALFIPSPPQKALLPPLQHALTKVTILISLTMSAIAACFFLIGLCHILLFTLVKEENSFKVLHHIGATKNLLYNRITLMAGFQTFIGGIFGILLSLPMINLLALFLRPFEHLSLWTESLWIGIFETALPLKPLLILWSFPFILTFLTIFLTQIILTIRHILKS